MKSTLDVSLVDVKGQIILADQLKIEQEQEKNIRLEHDLKKALEANEIKDDELLQLRASKLKHKQDASVWT